MSIKFTEAVKALTERAEKIYSEHPLALGFDKIFEAQKRISEKVEAIETLHETKKSDASNEETLRTASRLKVDLQKIERDVFLKQIDVEKSMDAGLYEHSKLAHTSYGVELRSIIRAMPIGERVKIIQDAIKANDKQILGAVLIADIPATLAGLTTELQAKFREQYWHTVLPEFVAARDAFRDLTEHIHATLKVGHETANTYGDEMRLKVLERDEGLHREARQKLGVV